MKEIQFRKIFKYFHLLFSLVSVDSQAALSAFSGFSFIYIRKKKEIHFENERNTL